MVYKNSCGGVKIAEEAAQYKCNQAIFFGC
jgi:hypothetical protein